MPNDEQSHNPFHAIHKQVADINRALGTTIGATRTRRLIEESLDEEFTFELASFKLTVGTVAVDLFNRHTFRTDDRAKSDPDFILGEKPHENAADALAPQLSFRRDRTWLKYKLEADAEATVDGTFFDAATRGAVTLAWYRGHDPNKRVADALWEDLSQPRFALVKRNVEALESDEALTLRARGKLSAAFSFEWSDFFAANLSVLGEMLDEGETLSIKAEVGATARVTAEIEDDFVLIFTRECPKRLRVAVRKARETSSNMRAGVHAKVRFTNPEDVANAVKGAKDGLIGPHVAQITDILEAPTAFDGLSPEDKALVDQVRSRLRVVDDSLDKLDGLRKTIADLDDKLKEEITTWAEARLEFSFTFEYNRVKTHLAIFQATFPSGRLREIHDALIRRDLATLLGQVSETGDGVNVEKFLSQESLKVDRSFGFSLGLGTWSAGEKTFSVTEETQRKNFDGHTQSSFSGESGYKGHWGSDKWAWRVGFTANMANYSNALEPRASEFDYSISLLAEFTEDAVSDDDMGRFVDQAVLWGAVNPAQTAVQTEKLVSMIAGKKKVTFSYAMRFEPEVIAEILDELARDNNGRFAQALGAAMPWGQDSVVQRNQGLRAQQYGRLWRWYLADQSRSPKQLGWRAGQQIKTIDPDLARREAKFWTTARTTTIAGIADLNRKTRAHWKQFVRGVHALHTARDQKGDLDDIKRAYSDMKCLWGQAHHIRAFGAFLLYMAAHHSDTWNDARHGNDKPQGEKRHTVERVFTVTCQDDKDAVQTEHMSTAVPELLWEGNGDA